MKTQAITRGWPPARREAQAARMRAQKPWRHSTGPRTPEGKARSRLNGYRHGLRSAAMRRLKSLMREQRRFLREFVVGKPRLTTEVTEVTEVTEKKEFFLCDPFLLRDLRVLRVKNTFFPVILSAAKDPAGFDKPMRSFAGAQDDNRGKPSPAGAGFPHMDSGPSPRYFIAATREICHGTGGAQKG